MLEPPSAFTEHCLIQDGGGTVTPPATRPIPPATYRRTPRSGPWPPHPHLPVQPSRALRTCHVNQQDSPPRLRKQESASGSPAGHAPGGSGEKLFS